MKVHITVTFIIQQASIDTCAQFGLRIGTWEVLGTDGLRWYWADSEREAIEKAKMAIDSHLSVTKTEHEE